MGLKRQGKSVKDGENTGKDEKRTGGTGKTRKRGKGNWLAPCHYFPMEIFKSQKRMLCHYNIIN
jgi:hypothetical protein